jgi:hypothetical protein
MHPDPYQALTAAYHQLTHRPPAWTRQPDLADCGGLDGIVDAIRADRPDPTRSDTTLRTLIAIGHADPTAITVALYALTGRLRARLTRSLTNEYRADTLGDLAAVVLDSDLTGPRLAARLVNRAHNRANKHHHRIRHHGHTDPKLVDPCPPDRVVALHDRHTSTADIADLAAARVDLERFHTAITAAIARHQLPANVWATYTNQRLQPTFIPPDAPFETRQRVAGHRAAQHLQPFIDHHLHGHAA